MQVCVERQIVVSAANPVEGMGLQGAWAHAWDFSFVVPPNVDKLSPPHKCSLHKHDFAAAHEKYKSGKRILFGYSVRRRRSDVLNRAECLDFISDIRKCRSGHTSVCPVHKYFDCIPCVFDQRGVSLELDAIHGGVGLKLDDQVLGAKQVVSIGADA